MNAEQLRKHLVAVLAQARQPLTTSQALMALGQDAELDQSRPVVVEEVYRALRILARRGVVRRVTDRPGRRAHWALRPTSALTKELAMTMPDPTVLVGNPGNALTVAQALLDSASAGHDVGYEIWASQAVVPLAALLHAASAGGINGGISWVVHAAPNTDATDGDQPGWFGAARRVAGVPLFVSALARTAAMDARQRDSVAKTITDALAGWSAPSQRRCGDE